MDCGHGGRQRDEGAVNYGDNSRRMHILISMDDSVRSAVAQLLLYGILFSVLW